MNSNMQNQFDELLHQKLYDFCEDPDEGLIDRIHQKKDRIIRLYRLIPLILSVVAITLAGMWFFSSENNRKSLMPAVESKPASVSEMPVSASKPVTLSGSGFLAVGNSTVSVSSSQTIANATTKSQVRLTEEAPLKAPLRGVSPTSVYSSEIIGCEAGFDFYTSYTGELFFINTSSINDGTEFLWNFGDGTYSNLTNPSHQYQKAGEYEVRLDVILNGKPTCHYAAVLTYSAATIQVEKAIKGTVFEEVFISKDAVVSLYKQTALGDKYELYSLHKTDASGNYLFTGLPNGKYLLLAENSGNPRFMPTWFGNVTLSEDADRIVIDDRNQQSNRAFDIHLQQARLSATLDMTTSLTNNADTGGAYVTLIDGYNNLVGTFKTDKYGRLINGQPKIPTGYYKVIDPATSNETTIEIGAGNSGTIDNYTDLVSDRSREMSKPFVATEPLVVMPNPAVSDIRFEIKLETHEQVLVRIVNTNGIEVYSETTRGEPGYNKFNIMIGSFKPGVYYVMVKKGQGVPVISQLIKAN